MKNEASIAAVAIIGAGSWGTSIAGVIADNLPDARVVMWAYERSVVSSINTLHENREYLPGVKLPSAISATSSIKDAVRGADVIILATPSKVIYDVSQKMARYVKSSAHIGFLSKGFCRIDNDIVTISQAVSRAVPSHKNRIIAISGPSHAEEVSHGFHTCLNVAGADVRARRAIAAVITCDHVQCRELNDVIGVELGGTLKNPAAIAAGMISVLPGCGDNLAGALISEALKEMMRLGRLFKADPETILDISGLGDLVATALSEHSRNRRFGRDIARQILTRETRLRLTDRILLRFKPEYVIERMGKSLHYLAEGAYAIEPLIDLASRHDIAIPVYRSLYEVLLNKKNPSLLIETIKDPQKFEELYSHTKIHVSDRKKGLETVRGAGFRAKIEERIRAHASAADWTITASLIEGLAGAGVSAGRPLGQDELGIIRNADARDAASTVTRLSKLYLNDIIDNYNSFFRWLYLRNKKMHFSFNPLGRGRTRVSVSGDTGKILAIHKSADLLYLPSFKSAYDFVPAIIAIVKLGLPFPRFYVPDSIISGKRELYLMKKAGGFIVDEGKNYNPLYRQTLHHYMATLLEHGVPVMLPQGSPPIRNYGMSSAEFSSLMADVLFNHSVEIVLVPMEISEIGGGVAKGGLHSLANRTVNIHFLEPIALSDYTDSPAPEENLRSLIEEVWK